MYEKEKRMNYHQLGKTDMKVSELSFGTWALGGDWGVMSEQDAVDGLNRAIDLGVNFFDTADVYGSGKSEMIIGKVLKTRPENIYVATKFGRRDDFTNPAYYTYDAVVNYCESSLTNLQREAIDLYQIHCPTFEIIKSGEVFEALEKLKISGKIRHYGVSVETDEQGLYVIEHANAASLQVIFNMLRQKPASELFARAKENGVGILARVPLASGLLTGKYTADHVFEVNDHRRYNKDGQAFNVGETFGGLEFAKGVALVDKLKTLIQHDGTLAQQALKWIMQQEGVTTVIPGFKNVQQVENNIGATYLTDFTQEELSRIHDFYWHDVHHYIRGDY